ITVQDVAVGTNPDFVAVGGFNGDGLQDLAVANYGGTVSIRPGKGDRSFSHPGGVTRRPQPPSVAGGGLYTHRNPRPPPPHPLTYTTRRSASIRFVTGDGPFSNPPDVAAGVAPASVAVGDFNGDGNLDLAAANTTSNTVSIRLGNGDGPFPSGPEIAVGANPA